MEDCKQFYTYIMLCADGTLYTGYTNDIQKRLRVHNAGRGAKYTRGRLPVSLLFVSEGTSKGSAQSLEAKIKRLSHKEKLLLIHDNTLNSLPKQNPSPHQQ